MVSDNNGIVVEPTAKNIAGAMRSLALDNDLRMSLSKSAFRSYDLRHSPEQYLKEYLRMAEGCT